jgi:DNA-directed RNA polymerase specialized sigma24 family protein
LLKQGNQDARNGFWVEFFDCARRVTWANLDNDERWDCVNDAFEKIFEKAKACRMSDLTGSYVHQAVRDQCRLRWLKRKRRPPMGPLPEWIGSLPDNDFEEIFEAAGLTAEEKAVVWLKTLWGMTWPEVAKKLGIPESTARRRYGEALRKLLDWYVRELNEGMPGPEDEEDLRQSLQKSEDIEEVFREVSLTDEQQEIVLLKLFGVKTCAEVDKVNPDERKGLTWKQISETCGIPIDTICRHFSGAFEKLRNAY